MEEKVLVPADQSIDLVARACQDRLDRVGQHLQLDLEPGLLLPETSDFREALRDLILFACVSAPPSCLLTLSAARPATRLTVVGSANLALRWQVADLASAGPRSIEGEAANAAVIPLRPGIRSAKTLVVSGEAKGICEAFEMLGWALQFELRGGGEEIVARVEYDG